MTSAALTQPSANTPSRSIDSSRDQAAELLHSEISAIVREEVGMHDAFASHIAAAIVRGLRRRNGAQQLYIPAPDKIERNAEIYNRFVGSNARELMAEFGISKARLYQIVNEERTRRGIPKVAFIGDI